MALPGVALDYSQGEGKRLYNLGTRSLLRLYICVHY